MDKHYKIRSVRLSDEVWEEAKRQRQKSKLTWNLFLRDLLRRSERKK